MLTVSTSFLAIFCTVLSKVEHNFNEVVLSQFPAPECCGKEGKKLFCVRSLENGNSKNLLGQINVVPSWGVGNNYPNLSG